MARGRKKTESSGYKMNKHKNGDYFYAYTLRPFATEEGKVVYRRCQWGRLDEGLKFHPGLSFMLLSEEEKAKFVFPEDWDLSELKSIPISSSNNKDDDVLPGLDTNLLETEPSTSLEAYNTEVQEPTNVKADSCAESSTEDSILSTSESNYVPSTPPGRNEEAGLNMMLSGATWLVEIWAKKIGLVDDLLAAFEGDKFVVDAFMSMVIYALTHNYSLDNFYTTQSYIKYPAYCILKEVELGRINARTGDREIEGFFRYWMKRHLEGEVYAFDSTLSGDIHSDSDPLGIRGTVFRYGYDVDDALKSEFIMLYSMSTGYPLCYFNYGEDNDGFQSFYDALKGFRNLGAQDYTLFTNRTYNGVHLQVELLTSAGLKLLMACETSSADVERLIETVKIEDHLPTNMQWDERGDVYYLQVHNEEGSGKKYGPDSRITLFYSPEKDMRDRMRLQHRIGNMNSNVESLAGQSNMVIKEDFSKANDLIDIQYSVATSDYKFSVVESGSVNKYKVNELTKLCGFYVARTFNLNLKPLDILNVFRFASERKKDFGILKDLLNLQRPYNDDRLPALNRIIKGKRFLLFLALIISASLKLTLESKPLLSKTFKDDIEMIMEMLSLKGFYKGNKLVDCAPLTPKQRLIISELHLDQCPGKEKSDVTDLLYHKLNEQKSK